ncbi:hypothetical protein PCLA_01f0151 [Pseudomonas citronellolis]|nr:hypothetical protein PCLA_01f0151 [Pseudomonas citronellolis]
MHWLLSSLLPARLFPAGSLGHPAQGHPSQSSSCPVQRK